MKKIIEFKQIKKEFLNGKIIANDDVSFNILEGEVHAIAGENGAGKSTLISMLFGLQKPTSGSIFVKGKKTNYYSAIDAINDGMGMVHQHFQLVEKFSVAENIILGNEDYSLGPLEIKKLKIELKQLTSKEQEQNKKNQAKITKIDKILKTHKTTTIGFLNRKKINEKINEIAKKYNFNINAKDKISTLTVGQQQKVEILKLLYKNSNILIFDEPTAMLTPGEIDQFLDSVLNFKKQGKTIIIITHKLNEIKKVADRVTVLRKGRYVGTKSVAKITANQLSKMMVGYNIVEPKLQKVKIGKDVLTIKNLTIKKNRIPKIDNVSFSVKAGEIVAIAGIEGNGQTELAHAICGINRHYTGEIFVNGNLINKLSVNKRNKLLSNIPEDRHKYGVILDLKSYENVVSKNLKQYSKFGFLNRNKMLKDANVIIQKYDVRGTDYGKSITSALSGGNQQKLVVGRELASNHNLILSFQATRGLDVGAINYIHNQIIKQRSEGKATLLISYDLNEILQLSDRVFVLSKGKITGHLLGKKIEKETIGKLMTTIKK